MKPDLPPQRDRFVRALAKIIRDYDLSDDVLAEALRMAERLRDELQH